MATLHKKFKLLQGLMSGEKAFTGPFYVVLDVTRRCNLRCIGCRYHSPEALRPTVGDHSIIDLSVPMFAKLCRDLKSLDTRTLFLMGEGEPLLNRDIFEMIAIAKNNGMHVTMITNGTLFSQENVLSLFESRIDALQVSLWASSVEGYRKQYPGTDPVNFEKVVSGLKLISSIKSQRKITAPVIRPYHPINRMNFEKIDEMVDLALATGCNEILLVPFLTNQGKGASYALSLDQEKVLHHSLLGLKKKLVRSPLKHNIDWLLRSYAAERGDKSLTSCYVGWFISRIRVDGSVFPCGVCDAPVGNLREKSFTEIWNSSAYRDFRRTAAAREGLAHLKGKCDCEFCCYFRDNIRVQNMFRWFAPFVRR